MTVTKFGRHPDIAGNGYVPYYYVFDHRGKLIRDHMCGDYHGGDGLKFIEIVEEALDRAPSLYLGEEPFSELADLAASVQAKKDLGKRVKELDATLAAEDTPEAVRAEATRLLEAVKSYTTKQLATAEGLQATSPSEVVPLLSRLDKELSGSSLGDTVSTRLAEAKKDKGLKQAARLAATFAKVRTTLAELDSCDSCKASGTRTFRHSCAGCRAGNQARVQGARKALVALVKKNPDLPYTKTIEAYLAELE